MAYSAKQIARYFLSQDPDAKVFKPATVEYLKDFNGIKSYEGNVRLNKYLHLAQNIYIAMTGKKLFEDDLYAYVNGGVVPVVQREYANLRGELQPTIPNLDDEVKQFLDRTLEIFNPAPVEELIEISHEDEEWGRKTILHNGKQKMDSLANAEEYEEQYADIIYVYNHKEFGIA